MITNSGSTIRNVTYIRARAIETRREQGLALRASMQLGEAGNTRLRQVEGAQIDLLLASHALETTRSAPFQASILKRSSSVPRTRTEPALRIAPPDP